MTMMARPESLSFGQALSLAAALAFFLMWLLGKSAY
jgi:hypothetical protein